MKERIVRRGEMRRLESKVDAGREDALGVAIGAEGKLILDE